MKAKKTKQKRTYQKSSDLKKYYTLGLPLLGLMGLLAVTGIVATLVLRYFFQAG